MIEINDNIFNQLGVADCICITTNAILKKNGEAVCGAGIALEAAKRWPHFPRMLGQLIKQRDNVPNIVFKIDNKTNICSFPTKVDWRKPSEINLIKESAKYLVKMANFYLWKKVCLPRPGCSNGKLLYEDVRKELLPILFDDRFEIYNNQNN